MYEDLLHRREVPCEPSRGARERVKALLTRLGLERPARWMHRRLRR
ncbi:MAG: hypothetical protein ACOC8F_03925 [Planctomycetota bacterium]